MSFLYLFYVQSLFHAHFLAIHDIDAPWQALHIFDAAQRYALQGVNSRASSACTGKKLASSAKRMKMFFFIRYVVFLVL